MDKSIVPVNQLTVRSSTGYEFSNSNPTEVVEIEDDDTSVETVKKQLEDLKLNHQFNEKDVPQIFKTLINDRLSDLKEINLQFDGAHALLGFLGFDDILIRFEKKTDEWKITYKQLNTTIETVNPEKSIIDHLWFVLKNPNIKLTNFGMVNYTNLNAEKRQILDSEKLNTLLQSMLNSINHQIHTESFDWVGCDEDTLLSMLKHLKPGALDTIRFVIPPKEEGNYQKYKEIVETDQWKQAKLINSSGFTPLKVDDFFHCQNFWLELASITPEDVLRVVEHSFNSSSHKSCKLSCEQTEYDINAIIDYLRSQNDGSTIKEIKMNDAETKFVCEIIKSGKHVLLFCYENYFLITNM